MQNPPLTGDFPTKGFLYQEVSLPRGFPTQRFPFQEVSMPRGSPTNKFPYQGVSLLNGFPLGKIPQDSDTDQPHWAPVLSAVCLISQVWSIFTKFQTVWMY